MYMYGTSLSYLRMRNVLRQSCRENQNTHFVFSKFFPPENHGIYEIMWENMAVSDRPQMNDSVMRRVRFACWITKARIQKSTLNI